MFDNLKPHYSRNYKFEKNISCDEFFFSWLGNVPFSGLHIELNNSKTYTRPSILVLDFLTQGTVMPFWLYRSPTLEHFHQEILSHSILPSQKVTLSIIPYYFTIHLAPNFYFTKQNIKIIYLHNKIIYFKT